MCRFLASRFDRGGGSVSRGRLRAARCIPALLLGLGLIVALPGAAYADHNFYTRFTERDGPTGSPARGVHAEFSWNYPRFDNGDDVPCADTETNQYVTTAIRGERVNGSFIDFGILTETWGGQLCPSTQYEIFVERSDLTGFSAHNYAETPATGTRDWAINRLPGGTPGCSSSFSYCWFFRLSNSSGIIFDHAWFGDELGAFNDFVRVSGRCNMATQTNCHANVTTSNAPRELDSLTWKNANDNWNPWAGKDSACVDHGGNADGKWIAADDVKLGFNTTMTGSLTNAC